MNVRKKLFLFISLLILFHSVVFTQEKDVAESKDHPLLSRMQSFYISSYNQYDYDSHEFYDVQDNEYVIEGKKWVIEYTLKEGFAPPGQLKVRKNHINAIKNIGGSILFDRGLYMKVAKDDKEIWIDVWVSSDGSDYRLTIVEKTTMEQEVIADPGAVAEDRRMTRKDASLPSGKKTLKPVLALQSIPKRKGMKDPEIQRIEQALAQTIQNRAAAYGNLSAVRQNVMKGFSMVCPDEAVSPPSPPAGPVPIPYPNVGMASDTTEGSKKVKINADKAAACENKSNFKKSESDEIGHKAKELTKLIQDRYEKGNLSDEDKVSLKNKLMATYKQAASIARALDKYVEEIEKLLEESKRELITFP